MGVGFFILQHAKTNYLRCIDGSENVFKRRSFIRLHKLQLDVVIELKDRHFTVFRYFLITQYVRIAGQNKALSKSFDKPRTCQVIQHTSCK